MRIADKMAFAQVNNNLAKNRTEMADLQNQAATQKRVTKPSDDPIAAARVLGARIEEKGNDQFIKNSNSAKAFLELSDQSLGELTESLIRAKELALSQATDGGSDEQSRRVTASEVEQIYNQSVQIANRKLGERYIFAGHMTTQMPFELSGEYRGDDGDIKIQINKDAFVAMNLPGDKVFLGKGIGQDGFIRPRQDTPTDIEQLQEHKQIEQERLSMNQANAEESSRLRAPTSVKASQKDGEEMGINVFDVLKKLEVGLKTDDKSSIQDSLDSIDQAINQIVFARSQLGARVSLVNTTIDTMQKSKIDNRVTASQLEDADAFQVISDINKNESTLKATLETSGKLIQPSLLDFLK